MCSGEAAQQRRSCDSRAPAAAATPLRPSAATHALLPPLPPSPLGSYGICSNCHGDASIVAQAPDAAMNSSSAATTGHPTSVGGGAPPLNMLFTTCRHCGVYQSRLQVLQTATGTPGYLAPETLA